VFKTVLDLLFPILCQGCGREGEYLCTACAAEIPEAEPRCIVCSRVSLLGRTHSACASRDWPLSGVIVCSSYDSESLQKLIRRLKYDSVRDIADPLAQLLADYFVKNDLIDYFSASAVVAVPLHKRRRRSRGFNQSALIAEKFATRLRFDYLPILERLKNNRPQVELKRAERLQNVANIFRAQPTPSLGERKILIIDDITTTGATLNECAKELKKQAPNEIWGLVVARN
jgi:ComF family protein